MNKVKKIGVLSLLGMLIVGCSCSKVDESTYQAAVNVYEETDGIYFSRVETISVDGEDTYTRKKISAKYLFNSNNMVTNMEYIRSVYTVSSSGANISDSTTKYYYSAERRTLYTHLSSVNRYKKTDVTYDEVFNINVSQGDEMLMIKGNFAPMFQLNEIEDFNIEDDNGKAIVTFAAICPSYEKCASNSDVLTYNYIIGTDGNIESLSYEIVNCDTTHTISYTFYSYGSNNVNIEFPADLESYIEK